jgi:two-component system, OmpR family, phosphate regulon sensor histidine kinase PhoR
LKTLESLAAALFEERDALVVRWRERVRELPSAKGLDVPTLNDHMPVWIAELPSALRAFVAEASDECKAASVPLAHGLQRFEDGFDIEEVVAEYNILRDCVHDMAERLEVDLRGRARRVVNKAFDDAIAAAVKAFAECQAREVQRRRAEHLAFVAHDLRTPLSAITFSAHILEQRLPVASREPETARLLKTLIRNAMQLDALVSQVLTENTHLLTELSVKPERRLFDLWPVVETLLQDVQALAAKAATRLVNQVPDELEVRADAGLVRRILQNLLGNAIAYTPGGEVTIGARSLADEDCVEVWVTDNGAGIARERIDKVFDPLETDPERDGTGLGLAIVKTFVEAHDGKVTVESVEGEGSTFRFTLPRAVAVASDSVKSPGEASQAVAVPLR